MRSIMVTGAARGIGRAVVERFATAGWRVCAVDVDADGVAALRDELGEPHLVEVMDVRDADAWRDVLARFTAEDGQLHVLVNNAGVLRGGRFADVDVADHRLTVDVNVTGVLLGCHAAHPHLAATAGARVVNLASASAIYGQPELASYSASKFAVRGLSEALDLEWEDDDVAVVALWPLFVETALVDGLDIGTTRSLGVRLTVDDVVTEVVRAAVGPRGRLAGPHRAVGVQARVLLASSRFSPAWLTRMVNKRFAAG